MLSSFFINSVFVSRYVTCLCFLNLLVIPGKAQQSEDVVYFVLTQECPISQKMIPEIKSILNEYGESYIKFFLIFSGEQHSDSSVTFFMKQHNLEKIPYRIDQPLDFVKKHQIRIAPTVCMMSDGQIVYRGRISDLYYSWGKRKIHEINRDFYIFLKKWTSGIKEIANAPMPVGCVLY